VTFSSSSSSSPCARRRKWCTGAPFGAPPASRRRRRSAPSTCRRLSLADSQGRPIGTVDQWTGSTAPVHGIASCSRQLCVSPPNRGRPRGTPSAPPPAALAILQKEPPVSGIQNHNLPPI
jgi:hypothetical protein